MIVEVPEVARGISNNLKHFLDNVIPGVPIGSFKKNQPIWFSRLASCNVHVNERRALLYRFMAIIK